MNIGNILNKLDDRLGIWIFKNNNIFSYNLFSYFYEKNIINPHSDLIENYKKINFLEFRDIIYDIFIYNIDLNECLYEIIGYFVENKKLDNEKLDSVFDNLY